MFATRMSAIVTSLSKPCGYSRTGIAVTNGTPLSGFFLKKKPHCRLYASAREFWFCSRPPRPTDSISNLICERSDLLCESSLRSSPALTAGAHWGTIPQR